MKIELKILEIKDLNSLKDLCEICFDIKSDVEIMKKEYKKILNNPNTKQIILKLENKIIGHIKYDIINDIFDMGKPYMYLSDLCIHPDYRGNGYSKLLMDYCEKEAINNNCKNIFLNSSEFRDIAHKLYEGLGYHIRDSRIYRKGLI
ncbi:MAG: GNAT family N-acetyltransferase [Bacilli bacterium]|nr:GNAT family N-acetyltransferase [Bacilli bacterium]